MLEYPYWDTTKKESGITFTDNGDGTIGISGTLIDPYFADFKFEARDKESSSSWLCLPSGEYTAFFDGPEMVSFTIMGYDGLSYNNLVYIQSSGSGENVANFTIDDNVRIYTYLEMFSEATYEGTAKVAIYAKSSDTAYSPYTGSTTPVSLTAEDGTAYELRSLPDGTRDEVGIVDGRWVLTRRVGSKTANGSEKWMIYDLNEKTLTVYWESAMSGAPHVCNIRLAQYMCESFNRTVDEGAFTSSKRGVFSTTNQGTDNTTIYFNPQEGIETVKDWKAWLADNPVTWYYKLATPETIDLGPADTPLLPETVSNVWAVSEPSTEVGVTYERDVTVAFSNLEANIAALTVATS